MSTRTPAGRGLAQSEDASRARTPVERGLPQREDSRSARTRAERGRPAERRRPAVKDEQHIVDANIYVLQAFSNVRSSIMILRALGVRHVTLAPPLQGM